MDITKIHWPDSSFDIIYCSHVLEHVPDDLKAIGEIFRVLIPGGWALIQVPISKKATLEDPSVTDPGERERLFWQNDHVRLYGLDIKEVNGQYIVIEINDNPTIYVQEESRRDPDVFERIIRYLTSDYDKYI